jgi:hypothetical protein
LWHFNGGSWSLLPTTENAPANTETDSSSNMVAVGPSSFLAVGDLGRVHRWNGAAWTKLAGGNRFDRIEAISARPAGDIWTARVEVDNERRPCTLRVEGYRGSKVQALPPLACVKRSGIVPRPMDTQLLAFGDSDVWLRAGRVAPATGEVMGEHVLEHWDGAAWTQVLPDGSPKDVVVTATGMWGAASNDLWVSYTEYRPTTTMEQGFLRHWDGKTWTTSPERFKALGGTAADNVWAIGGEGQVYRWDGRSWAALPQAQLAPRETAFARVIVPVSGTEAWITPLDNDGRTAHVFAGTVSRAKIAQSVGWASGPYDVWFLGTYPGGIEPSLRRWDGVGFVSDTVPPVGPQLFAIDGARANDTWVGGAGGGLLRTALSAAVGDTH